MVLQINKPGQTGYEDRKKKNTSKKKTNQTDKKDQK